MSFFGIRPVALGLALAFGGLSGAVTAAPLPPASSPQLLQNDPALQTRVTVEAVGRPLGDVFRDLSARLPVDLVAAPSVADQRMTLVVTNEPLFHVMERLPGLLSHTPDRPHGYHWEKMDRPTGSRPAYRFWRDTASLAEEQAMLDYPRLRAAQLLRGFRDVARLSPEQKQAAFKANKDNLPSWMFFEPPTDPTVRAVRGLSDAQITALMSGESVPLNPSDFAAEIANYNKAWHDSETKQRAIFLSSGAPDPYPNGVPDTGPQPPVITVVREDQDGQDPERAADFGIALLGVSPPGELSFGRGQLEPLKNWDGFAPFPETPAGPVIDLTPYLTGPQVTKVQKGDVAFTLAALARAAKINVYEEHFIAPSAVFGTRSEGLKTLKDTLPHLINAICNEWGYYPQKVGDDYLFWPPAWAQDRAADVPDRLLAKWRQRLHTQGRFTLADRTGMAAALTWPQVKITLDLAIPESGPWDMRKGYDVLRVLGRLGPAERQAAFSPDGLPLAQMPAWEQQALLADLGRDLGDTSADQLAASRLTVQVQQDGPPRLQQPIERVIVEIADGDKRVFTARLAYDTAPQVARDTR